MTIIFDFLEPNLKNFKACLAKTKHATLLQSYAYAYAIRMTQKLMPRLALIKKHDQEIGFFCAHEASIFFNFFRVFTLDRGPIWFDGHGSTEDWEGFAKSLNNYIPKKFGTSRRLMPEIAHSPQNIDLFTRHGWEYRESKKHYKTISVGLTPDEESLRANLKRNWRNKLNKSEKITMEMAVSDNTQKELEWFLQEYLRDRIQGKYPGPGLRFSSYLFGEAVKSKDLIILKAVQADKIIAAIALLTHGDQATYQIGWTTRAGRAANAHHFLLWNAMLLLKQKGLYNIDMGGINDESASGVTEFKRGIGGTEIELIGQFG